MTQMRPRELAFDTERMGSDVGVAAMEQRADHFQELVFVDGAAVVSESTGTCLAMGLERVRASMTLGWRDLVAGQLAEVSAVAQGRCSPVVAQAPMATRVWETRRIFLMRPRQGRGDEPSTSEPCTCPFDIRRVASGEAISINPGDGHHPHNPAGSIRQPSQDVNFQTASFGSCWSLDTTPPFSRPGTRRVHSQTPACPCRQTRTELAVLLHWPRPHFILCSMEGNSWSSLDMTFFQLQQGETHHDLRTAIMATVFSGWETAPV